MADNPGKSATQTHSTNLADQAPALVWLADANMLRYSFNNRWLTFTGRPLEQELQNGWTEAIHQEDVIRCFSTYSASFKAQTEFTVHYRLRRHDGAYRWLVEQGVPRYAADGAFTGFAGSCLDIDEVLKQQLEDLYKPSMIEQALNEELAATNEELSATNEELVTTNEELVESQHRLETMVDDLAGRDQKIRSIVESAPFPIGVYIGREMRIELANQSIIDVWGKGSDIVGRTYAEVLPELRDTGIYEQLDRVFTTGEPFHARNQRVDLVVDGKLQPFYFNYSFTPLYSAAGEIYGVMNTAAEITDLVVAKQQVEQSERNLHNMILQAPVAMCILLGPDYVVEVANEKMIELWGKPVKAVWNKPIFEGLPEAREQGLEQLLFDAYHNGVAYHASEQPVQLLRDGTIDTIYQNFVYEPYRDIDGTILGVIAITIEVTEQVMARRELEAREAELLLTKQRLEEELEAGKKLQAQKDSFIGIASHELKTPLTSLTAIIQIVGNKLKTSADPYIPTALEKANAQAKKMASLINGFLNISRLEAGKIVMDKQQFNLHKLLEETVDDLGMTTQGHTIELADSATTEVFADREKIGSVVSNLISNAIKYSHKGTSITVRSQVEDGFVKVSVTDTGVGISSNDINKLFERYYRVESSQNRHISGFGIGLYLSSEIIKQHQGRIWAESEEGIGSTFHFTLPLP
ncbi:hypothetical protein DJ568_15020 [Mucilaginibacter hurinus]|uniref:histidine kinase n=1 Tax=Mucilaginibacter hurinus TaxID=2201324 RepID=A0A367GKK4_9SPHI|nr:ATP-binding protein [Mucilaginibacter hurinus]RCH53850.1 hypothetical protein DJ568_15020 [Mucilaginibacter hurinus]